MSLWSKVRGVSNKALQSKQAALLVLRTSLVSLLYFFTITSALVSGGKDTVAGFVQVQNICYVISSFASLGFYSILMFYGSRSKKASSWALWQMLVWTPVSLVICGLCSLASEAWAPTVGVGWLTFFAWSFTASMAITGLTLGQGRFALYSLIEIGGAAAFLGAVILVPALDHDSFALNICYALICLVKFGVYLLTAKTLAIVSLPELPRQRSRRFPSVPLLRRFGGPNWLAGALSVLVYRLMLTMLQGGTGTKAADIVVCWAIYDRVQMIVQVANTLAFRRVAGDPGARAGVLRLIDRAYPLVASVVFILVSCGIVLWTDISGNSIDPSALALGFIFFVWGYRTIVQNLLTAVRRYGLITAELSLLLSFWGIVMAIQAQKPLAWPALVSLATMAVLVSALRLRSQVLKGETSSHG